MIGIQNIASGLKLGHDGIWHSESFSEISYPEGGNADCFRIEDSSFWFLHRNKCIIAGMKSFPPSGPVFDIGGGNGYVALAITQSGFEAVLVEPSRVGAINAKARGLDQIVCSAFDDAKFVPRSLPAVGIFDVLEHVEDDLSFLKAIRKVLIAGGRLYITVPAYTVLWSSEDKYAGHYRRYTLQLLSKKLIVSGFQVEYRTYFFRFLPIPIFLFRTLPSKLGLRSESMPERVHKEHAAGSTIFRRLIDAILAGEVKNIRRNITMRFGANCLVIAKTSQKPLNQL